MQFFIIAVKDLFEKDHSTFSKGDKNQNNALMICLKKRKMTFADMLLASSETNINIEDANGDTAALLALKNDMRITNAVNIYHFLSLKNDMKNCLKKILARKDLSINHKNKEGQSLLSIAMEKKELDVIKTILDKPNVDLDYVEERLLFALNKDMDKIAEILGKFIHLDFKFHLFSPFHSSRFSCQRKKVFPT